MIIDTFFDFFGLLTSITLFKSIATFYGTHTIMWDIPPFHMEFEE